jgi:xanthine dehydrogenase molybdopterin-binding subunit B
MITQTHEYKIQSIFLPDCVEVMGKKILTFFCNYRGVIGSTVCTHSVTATGEPPLCMSCSVLFALRHALDSARKEAGKPDEWYQIGMLISLILKSIYLVLNWKPP